ncbi:MAG: glycoside hydrolase family 16 protein [Terricaulis sp.]
MVSALALGGIMLAGAFLGSTMLQSAPAVAAAAKTGAEARSFLPETPYTLRESFSDEFDALSLWDGQTGTWATQFYYDGIANRTLTSNGELQMYVDPGFAGTGSQPLGLNPFELHDGVLDIVATRVPDQISRQMWDYRYASGLLTTRRTFTQTYGYFETRAKLPEGMGLWPAFWLLPEDGSWPPEIDVMEQLGREPSVAYVGVHSDVYADHTLRVELGETTENFHTYGVLWDPEHVTWFIDGRQVRQIATPSDMHKPMYMLVNLAIGGGWAWEPNELTRFPARMSVDYVRAYALDPR